MLRLEDLALSYAAAEARAGRVDAVAASSAEFPPGSIGSIVGPSGCGKTSLVRAMAGLLKPSSGRLLVRGAPLAGIRPGTAVIFQDYGLLPWKTVEANVELPLLLRGAPARVRRARAAELLEELGLAAFARFYPARLSGGMRQRVAIARALATEPDLLLMDEPFSSLDALSRESMQDALLAARGRRAMTVVLVTHSIDEAVYLSEAVYVMTGRNPGAITAKVDAGPAAGAPRERGPSYRSEPRFLELCGAVRRALEEGAQAAGAAGRAR